jgi:UDP-GlcNAc:undecaprenyl-phosphate GlcNAc-1-phosphate transferase
MRSASVFLITFFITYFSCIFLRKLALKLNILDVPGGRKVHKIATPLLGGVSIYFGVFFSFLFNLKYLNTLWPVIIGATIILVIGVLNDIRELNVKFRMLSQVLATLVVMSAGIRTSFLPNTCLGDIGEFILTMVWIIGVTNAYNYLDGLDGLAAGSAIINSFCFMAILYNTGQYEIGLLAIVLIAACLGFLPHNFKRKKMFLGDSGSTFIGFVLANFALVGYWANDNIVKISIPILILGVPIFDMIFTTILRFKEGKVKTIFEWLKYGGRDHFHHYLVDLGLSPRGAVFFIYAVTLSLGVSAVMVSNDKAYEAFLSLSQACIIFGIIATLIIVGKRHRSGWNEE